MANSKISALTEKSNPDLDDELAIVDSATGTSKKAKARNFSAHELVIDAKTDTQAATKLLSAVASLSAHGGEIKIRSGAVNMGTTTLVLPEGVVVNGCGTGVGSLWSNSKGARLYWTGPTDQNNCVKITGSYAGVRGLLLDAPATLTGDILVADHATALFYPVVRDVQINNGPTGASYWGMIIKNFQLPDVVNVHMRTNSNGAKFETDSATYNLGNGFVVGVVVQIYTAGRVGIEVKSLANASGNGALNLCTFDSCGALAMTTGAAVGSTGLLLTGARNCTFVTPDVENCETLLSLQNSGTAYSQYNAFITPTFIAAPAYDAVFKANVKATVESGNNTFHGGRIQTPLTSTSPMYLAPLTLYDDKTLAGSGAGSVQPNMYLNVRGTSGYHPLYLPQVRGRYSYNMGWSGEVIPMPYNNYNPDVTVGMVVCHETTNLGVRSSGYNGVTHIAGVARTNAYNSASVPVTGYVAPARQVIDVQVDGVANDVILTTHGGVSRYDDLYICTLAGHNGKVNNATNLLAAGQNVRAEHFFGRAMTTAASGATVTADFGGIYRPSVEPGASGTATLVAGAVTVSTPKIGANTRVMLTVNGTAPAGRIYEVLASRVAGTSFLIQSTDGTDTCAVAWSLEG